MENKCPKCGAPVRAGAPFCINCGRHLNWCPKCGSIVRSGETICGNCGTNLKGGQSRKVTTASNESASKKVEPPTPAYQSGSPASVQTPEDKPVTQEGSSGHGKLILIGLAAVVIIGGYFFMGDDKPSAKPAPTQVQTEQKQKKSAQTPAAAPAPAPKKQELKIAIDSPKPEGVFIYFHRKITEHELRSAYNCFSPDYKNQIDYSGWAPGYDTTLKSIPGNIEVLENDGNRAVLSYRLKAVDRAGDTTKTQYFRGKCTLYKIDGLWKIDEITARVD